MRLHMILAVEIAVLAAASPHMALARLADAGAVGKPRGNPDIQRFTPRLDLLSAARRALCLPLPAGSVARAARAREHHVAPGRLHHAGALALPAPRFGRVHTAEPLARAAMFLPRHRDAAGAAAHRLFETEIEGLMKIGPANRRAFVAARL